MSEFESSIAMKFIRNNIAAIVLSLIGIVLLLINSFSTGVNGETDSISHYLIARYAFKYPENFLNHWGKPLFTILVAPLAQFGYSGAVIFNLICGLLSAWFAYLIAKKLNYKYAWVAIIFTIFTPVYLIIMFSSLTEILFSLVLIFAIYLFLSEQYAWSAIVISLIPFSRTEGIMFIFLFIPALVWIKKYKALPFLLTGVIVFSLLGWPLYHDPFWFFTKMPYSNISSGMYGSGSFWFYFVKMRTILNLPLILLFTIGLVRSLLNFKKRFQKPINKEFVTFYLLIIFSFFGFVLVQSFLWWQGMLGVLASTRFIACVLPLSALIALTGFEWILNNFKTSKAFSLMIITIIMTWVIYTPSRYNQLPVKTGKNFAVMQQLTNWLKTSPFSNQKALYSDPLFPFYMDIDPYDNQRCLRIYSYDNLNPSERLKSGELIIWDSQFSGFEGHLPFDSIVKNQNLKLINTFTPVKSFNIIGNQKYKLAVFIKK